MNHTYLSDLVMISNYYTLDYYELLRKYLAENDITKEDLIKYNNWLWEELKITQQLQEEYQATVNPDFVGLENIIGKSYVYEITKLKKEDIIEHPDKCLDSIKSSGITAYKFQVKFCIYALENLIKDERYWSRQLLH